MIFSSKKDIVKKMKEVARHIVEQEASKHNLDITIYPLTLVEYYRSDVFRNNFILIDDQNNKKYNFNAILEALRYRAIYRPKQKDIVVFIRGLNRRKTDEFEEIYSNFIASIYHELKHRYQANQRKNARKLDYQTIVFDIEHLVRTEDRTYYFEHHDDFYTEIEAHLYGVTNALEYLKKTHELTGLQRESLKERKRLYESKLQSYSLKEQIERFHHAIQNNSELKTEDLEGWVKIFYNANKTFKSLEEILNNPGIKNWMDESVLNAFITSRPFLESVDFVSLNAEHQQLIINALNSNLNLELVKRKNMHEVLHQKHITTAHWLELDTLIASRIAYYMQKIRGFTNKLSKVQEKPNDLDETFKQKK